MSNEIDALFQKHCGFTQGFPYPDWPALWEWCEKSVSEPERDAFWNQIASIWMDRVLQRLGPAYSRYDSDEFILVTSEPGRTAAGMLKFCDEKLPVILETLHGIALDLGYGKHIVLHFENSQVYWEYLSFFYPEGTSPESAGVFLDPGYGHVAIASEYNWATETILVHEITHGCLGHLDIPRWLDEGLARLVEVECGLSAWLVLGQESAQKHYDHWDEDAVQAFWRGETFSDPDDYFELSYELAEIMMRHIKNDPAGQDEMFVRFVNEAEWEDAGESAALRHLNRSLGEIMGIFLGPGNWAPVPAATAVNPDNEPSSPCQDD